jgi:hypothetical protein
VPKISGVVADEGISAGISFLTQETLPTAPINPSWHQCEKLFRYQREQGPLPIDREKSISLTTQEWNGHRRQTDK